jgi:hypothetical protein
LHRSNVDASAAAAPRRPRGRLPELGQKLAAAFANRLVSSAVIREHMNGEEAAILS